MPQTSDLKLLLSICTHLLGSLWVLQSTWQRFDLILISPLSHFVSCSMSNSVSSLFLSSSIHSPIHPSLFVLSSIHHPSDITLIKYYQLPETWFHLHFITLVFSITIASTLPHLNRATWWLCWSAHLKKSVCYSSSLHTFVHFKSQRVTLSSLLQDLILLPLWPWYFLCLSLATPLFSVCVGPALHGPTKCPWGWYYFLGWFFCGYLHWRCS